MRSQFWLDLAQIKLAGNFREDGFPRLKRHSKIQGCQSHSLVDQTSQVHFNLMLGLVVKGPMFKLLQIKIALKPPVEMTEQI